MPARPKPPAIEIPDLTLPMHRIEFRDGQWADIKTDGLTNRENRQIVDAFARAVRGINATAGAQECGRQLVQSWSLNGIDPVRVAGELMDDAWDSVPGEYAEVICAYAYAAWGAWRGRARPFSEKTTTSEPG